MKSLTLTRPDDWHVHFRDGDALSRTVPDTARQFARAIAMPNLPTPITTVDSALSYRDRILTAVPADLSFEPLMTLYLTDQTTPETITAAAKSDAIKAIKLYPAGATTHSDAGVSSLEALYPTFAAMEKMDLPLLIHGEVTDPAVDTFDKEAVFIERQLQPLLREFPALRVVLEHISDSLGDGEFDAALTRTRNYGAKIGFSYDVPNWFDYNISGSFMRDARDTDLIGMVIDQGTGTLINAANSNFPTQNDTRRTAVYSLHADAETGPYSVVANWATLARNLVQEGSGFEPGTGDKNETKSWTMDLGAGYAFKMKGHNSQSRVGYERSGEAAILALPRTRYLASAEMDLFRNTQLTVQYVHDVDYDLNTAIPQISGTGLTNNSVTLRAAVQF